MILTLILLTIFSALSPQPAENDSLDGNLIIRTDDLMNLLEADFISFDRLSFTSHSQEFGYFGPQPVFVVDGLPVDVSFFGMINPYHLPAAKGRVEQKQSGSLFHDPAAGSRFIRLDTGELVKGVSVYGGVKMSNESGEPGPWVFDPERVTPNIERFGPGIDLELQLAGNRFYGKGLFRYHRQMNTNLSVERRMKGMVSLPDEGEWLRAEAITQTGMIEAGYRGDQFQIRARTIIAESDEFLYFQPLGREIPSKPGLHQTILAADADLSQRWSINSYAQLTDKRIGFRRNRFAHEFDWAEQTRELFSALKHRRVNQDIVIGSRYRSIAADAPGVDDNLRYYFNLFSELRWRVNNAVTAEIGHDVTFHSNAPALRLSAGVERGMTSSWKSSAKISYNEVLPEFHNPSTDLIRRGYSISERFGIPFAPVGSFGKSRLLTASVTQNVAVHNDLMVTGSLKHISHFALPIPFQPVQYDAVFHTMPGTFQLFDGQTGRRGIADLQIAHRASTSFAHSLRAVYSATLSGGEIYRGYWEQSPDLWIRYSATYSPFRDIELNAQLRYRSGTSWNEFENLDGESFRSFNVQYPFSFGEFTSSPPSHLNADLTAAKWLWNQRLRIILSGKNVLNREYFPHPLAVREGFTFSLKAEMRF